MEAVNTAVGLNDVKSALQTGLGDAFPLYWRHLRNWILSPTLQEELQFNLTPIFKDNHNLIHLHNQYVRGIFSVAYTDTPLIDDRTIATPEETSQENGFTDKTQDPVVEPGTRSPTRRFRPRQRIRRRGFRQSQPEAAEDESEDVVEDNSEDGEMEVDEVVRSPSPEEYVPLFRVYFEPVKRKRKRFESESEETEDELEETAENSEDEDEVEEEVNYEEAELSEADEGQEYEGEVEVEQDEPAEPGECEELQTQEDEMEVDQCQIDAEAEIEINQSHIGAETEVEIDQSQISAEAEVEIDHNEAEVEIEFPDQDLQPVETTELEFEPEGEGEETQHVELESEGVEEPETTEESESESETTDEEEEQKSVVPKKYLEDLIESSAPRRGSLEIIPNVTYVDKLLDKYVTKEPHLGYYFQPRKGPDQPLLTSNASIKGKVLSILWQYRLINIQAAAVDHIVEASQTHILTIIKAMIKRRKSYKVSGEGTSHSFGQERENPYLIHAGDERLHEVNSSQKPDTDLPHVPPDVTPWDERERQAVYQIARRYTPNPPKYQTKIGPTELYEAIQANKGLIPSKELRAKLVEGLLMKMRGHNESVMNDDEKNNNSRVWESQEAHSSSQNGNGVIATAATGYNYDEDDEDDDEAGELYPVCSY